MALSVGILGLPNVGKTSVFNALTNIQVDAQNYPFSTIEPNSGIVQINDPRLEVLAKLNNCKKIIPAIIEFVDIAGLAKGASKGEGLGNQFLSHIREVSVIAHVVRCFEDENISHISDELNPADDIDIINTELLLADLEMAEKMLENLKKKIKRVKDKDIHERFALLEKILPCLEKEIPVRKMEFSEEETKIAHAMSFLTHKKVIYIANIGEDLIGNANDIVKTVQDVAAASGDEFAEISAKIEEEILKLSDEEQEEYRKELGVGESGLDIIVKKCFNLLGLQTYLTTGEKETRAWTIKKGDTAPQAAGVIHSDFERGFIRANIVSYDDFVENNGLKGAKEKGVMRQEGKDYIMQEGDVVEFLFNV